MRKIGAFEAKKRLVAPALVRIELRRWRLRSAFAPVPNACHRSHSIGRPSNRIATKVGLESGPGHFRYPFAWLCFAPLLQSC